MEQHMVIQYWGVRGSVAVPGPQTYRYGGNTSCVTVDFGDSILVIDTGTGVIPLGKYLLGSTKRVFIVYSHLHLDHIRGFPMFAPLYDKGCAVTLVGFESGTREWFPTDMLDGVHFPAHFLNIPCSIAKAPSALLGTVMGDEIRLSHHPVHHPGGAFAIRVDAFGKSFVHVADNELIPGHKSYESLLQFARGADVLSHDGQYDESQYPEKTGWGHSTWQRACGLALEASVGRLVLFHHDPDNEDVVLDEVQEQAAQMMHPVPCTVSYEGLRINLFEGP